MKLLIVKSQEESSWGSCRVISPNLHQLYLGLDSSFQITWFELPPDLVKGELESKKSFIAQLRETLERTRPDRIVFIDHLPVPASIIAHLSLHMNVRKLPPVIFHLYGDFTYFGSEWNFLNNELIGHSLEFIVASHSQKLLVEEFLEEKHSVSKLCFPVSRLDYFYSEEERTKGRFEYSLEEDDFVILYSGRISLQKNVDILINEFFKLKKITNKKIKLWIVGSFDDVGAEFLGYQTFLGYMFSKIQSQLESYDEIELSDLIFFGHQQKKELRKLKMAADLFVSLSLYHDEDYGMSPAEALATGLPSMLTDWGGYSSFASSTNWHCQLIPAEIAESGLEIELGSFQESVLRLIELSKENDKLRASRSLEFLKKFSIDSNVSPLKAILLTPLKPFGGFNWLLEQYATALSMNWSKNKLNKFLTPSSRGFYNQVYKSYISSKQDNLNDHI